jgi:hypothetical protein
MTDFATIADRDINRRRLTMGRHVCRLTFLVLLGGTASGAGGQPKAEVLDPEAARDALIRFVKANPKASEAPAREEDLRKAKIATEEDGTFTIHGTHVNPKTKSYSRVVATGHRPGLSGGVIIQCSGSFKRDEKGTWAVVDAKFSYTCVLAPPQPAGK